jgi:putative ABC transport system permease protein
VGIRKVLGASVGNIIYMFSKEFTVLVAFAFLIAAPLGYFFMKSWLEGFYYRINIGWEVFLVSILLSVLIAWITVGYKALRAALSNPIKALKYE